jgi:uncharacterized RDD family membrane protein YckC
MNVSEETKSYVTPYAFGVSDALLGKALASPLRRLCSLLLDLIVVASLTLMSFTAFTFVMLLISIVGYVKSKVRDGGERAQTIFVTMGIVSVLMLSSAMLLNNVESGLSWSDSQQILADDVETPTKQEVEDAEPEVKEGQNSYSVIEYVRTFLADMGLGFGWAAVYFSVFIAWFNGQTMGKMLCRIKVIKIDAKPLSFWESFERYGGYSAGLATGLMGFLQIIWDPNRQAIHDKISETVVLDLRKPDKAN